MEWKSDKWIYLAQNRYVLEAGKPWGTVKREEIN
jgi:hypothetical protein